MVTAPTYSEVFAYITTAAGQLLQLKPVFATWALQYVFPSIAVILVAIFGVRVALSHIDDWPVRAGSLIMALAINFSILFFWVNPFPGLGTSLPGGLAATADAFTNAISTQTLEQLLTDVEGRQQGAGAPDKDNTSGSVTYLFYRGILLLFEFLALGVIVLSFGGFAVFVVLGPIFIPLGLLPRTSRFFDYWFGGLVQLAMMRVVAAAVLMVVSSVIHQAFSSIPWYLYVIDLEDVGPVLTVVVLACAYFVFKIPQLTAKLVGGDAGAVSGLGGWMAGTVSRAITVTTAVL